MSVDSDVVSTSLEEMALALSRSSPDEITRFLRSLLTPAETDEIAKRWALVKALAGGTPQRQIAHDLGLSLCKITRGSRELKREDSPFGRMLAEAGVPTGPGGRPRRGRARQEQGGTRDAAVPGPPSTPGD